MSSWNSRFAVALLSSAALAGGFFGGAVLLDRVDFARAESQVELSRQQLAHVEDMASVFREVNKVVEPSVVMLEVTRTVHFGSSEHRREHAAQVLQRQRPGRPDAPNAPTRPTPQRPNAPDQQQDFEQEDTGSGVIMETATATATS